MKAVAFDSFGGPEVLKVVEVPEPHPTGAEVRVKTMAAGVNALDWKIRSGGAPFPIDLPFIGGLEVAGIVDEVGPDTTGVSVGDEVFGLTQRGLAEQAILSDFAMKPAGLSWALAAALPVSVETATRTLNQLGLQSGHTLLVNGAAGNVGSAAVQLARAAGATVIGTASEKNHAFLESLGCIPVTYGTGMIDRVRAAAPGGIDIALDCAGHGALEDLVALAGSPDHVVTIADPTAAQHGVRFSAGGAPPSADDLTRVAALVADGQFKVLIDQTFTLDQTADAQQLSHTGHSNGKLVILLSDHEQ